MNLAPEDKAKSPEVKSNNSQPRKDLEHGVLRPVSVFFLFVIGVFIVFTYFDFFDYAEDVRTDLAMRNKALAYVFDLKLVALSISSNDLDSAIRPSDTEAVMSGHFGR